MPFLTYNLKTKTSDYINPFPLNIFKDYENKILILKAKLESNDFKPKNKKS